MFWGKYICCIASMQNRREPTTPLNDSMQDCLATSKTIVCRVVLLYYEVQWTLLSRIAQHHEVNPTGSGLTSQSSTNVMKLRSGLKAVKQIWMRLIKQ